MFVYKCPDLGKHVVGRNEQEEIKHVGLIKKVSKYMYNSK